MEKEGGRELVGAASVLVQKDSELHEALYCENERLIPHCSSAILILFKNLMDSVQKPLQKFRLSLVLFPFVQVAFTDRKCGLHPPY